MELNRYKEAIFFRIHVASLYTGSGAQPLCKSKSLHVKNEMIAPSLGAIISLPKELGDAPKNGGDISALESQGKCSQSNPALCTILLRTGIGPHCFISFTSEVTR